MNGFCWSLSSLFKTKKYNTCRFPCVLLLPLFTWSFCCWWVLFFFTFYGNSTIRFKFLIKYDINYSVSGKAQHRRSQKPNHCSTNIQKYRDQAREDKVILPCLPLHHSHNWRLRNHPYLYWQMSRETGIDMWWNTIQYFYRKSFFVWII